MKKIFIVALVFLVGFCSCGRATLPAETTTEKDNYATTSKKSTTVNEKPTWIAADANTAFSSIVEDVLSRPNGYDMLNDFVLYDTDDEDIPALLVGVENPFSYVSEIFTFQNGAAEQVLSVDYDTGDTYICPLKTGVIKTGSFGVSTNSYYRLDEKGQLKLIVKLDSYGDERGLFRVNPTDSENDFDFYFIPDGTEVRISQEEYERLQKEMEGDGKTVDLDWKPLAEYGR